MHWLKLSYKILDWEWYTDANTMRLFIHCLLKANRKKGRYKGHNIEPGSFVTGRKILAEELKLTEKQIRTALKHLKGTREVATLNCGQFSIVTVKNWNKYQEVGQVGGQEGARKGPGEGQEGATIRECKNKKSEEKPPIIPQNYLNMQSNLKMDKSKIENCFSKSDFLTYAAMNRESLDYDELVKSIRNISHQDFDYQSVRQLVIAHEKKNAMSAYEKLMKERGVM